MKFLVLGQAHQLHPLIFIFMKACFPYDPHHLQTWHRSQALSSTTSVDRRLPLANHFLMIGFLSIESIDNSFVAD